MRRRIYPQAIIEALEARAKAGEAVTLGEARSIIGSLGFPSKMPGSSYGLPARACITGAKLAKIPGTACHTCYALADCYTWTNPQKAQHRRLAAITHPKWIDAMVAVLSNAHATRFKRIDLGLRGKKLARVGTRYRLNEMGFHRWHDSGDLQTVEHFARICEIAKRTPKIRHWLPTQELRLVVRYVKGGGLIPSNLLVRASGVLIDGVAPKSWPHVSTVVKDRVPEGALLCPAPRQGTRCLDCRACWSASVPHIAYKVH